MSFDLKLSNGDLKLGSNNDLAQVQDGEKLEQDILKIVTTDLGANPLYPWYGCPISQTMVGTAFDHVFIKNQMSNQLRFAISNLQKLQAEQLKSDQYVTPMEHIASIQNAIIDRNRIEPRFFNIDLTVLSKAFRRVQAQFQIEI